MYKFNKLILIGLILIIFMSFNYAGDVLEHDGFEDGDYTSNWVWSEIIGGSNINVGGTAHSGSYGLEINRSGGTGVLRTTLNNPATSNTYSVWLRYNNADTQAGMTITRSDASGLYNITPDIYSGQFRVNECDSGPTNKYAVSINTWYQIIIDYVDSAGTYDYTLKDTSGSTLASGTETIACAFTPYYLQLNTSAGSSSGFYDDVNYYSSFTNPFTLNVSNPTTGEQITGTTDINISVTDLNREITPMAKIYYSSTAGLYSNLIYSDTNLLDGVGFVCDSYDFSTAKTCSYAWNTLLVTDGNYFIDANLFNADYNKLASGGEFEINNYIITSDFNATNFQVDSYIQLTDTSTASNITINSWQWIVNGVNKATTQNYNHLTSANQDLNICLTASGTGDDTNTYSDTICKSVLTWDTINPTIDVNISNSTYGFVTDYNIDYNMICQDNLSPIQNKITSNNAGTITTIYDSNDTNGTLISDTLSITLGNSAILTFTCTDSSNNVATYTSNPFYAIRFRLVNEETGVQLTSSDIGTDFNIARVFTPDGNFSFNFKDTNSIDTNFFSTTNNLWFEFQYKDVAATKINRQIDFSYTEDSNTAICVPDFQTFYQQRFVANSAKAIVIKNNVSDCYVFAGELNYAYDTGYSVTTYLIPLPYYLYTWVSGVKTYLALLDGGVPTAYNIDAIIFSRQGFNISVGQDTIAFEPLKTNGIYDTNTMQIYYESYDNTNTSLALEIKLGDGTSLWNYTEYTEPNDLLVNFFWGGMDVNLDEILTLEVTKTNADGETVNSNYYFTLYGGAYQDNVSNEWAIILAVLFFLFGITLVAYDKALGLFGIIVCVVSLYIATLASGAWWVNLIVAAFVIIMAYIFLLNSSGGKIA